MVVGELACDQVVALSFGSTNKRQVSASLWLTHSLRVRLPIEAHGPTVLLARTHETVNF
jgi:hypothetical protein